MFKAVEVQDKTLGHLQTASPSESSYVEKQRRDISPGAERALALAGLADNMPLPLVLEVALLSRETAGPRPRSAEQRIPAAERSAP
ncbi:hypothetical protein HPB52_017534 [Rhipicephalus sanguineus]|uniref:Uncharacterized protein n=1 Tax=Rhipicephalus sanguineus TaxID=34632 RepID=A0A9D4PPM1_RHISA|nr:hypothetical protein HPB52_017534 [Rhipicephalus sanguineus]